jgi:hypothetical protein
LNKTLARLEWRVAVCASETAVGRASCRREYAMLKISRNKALLEWDEPGTPHRYWMKRMSWKDWLKLTVPDFAKYFLFMTGIWVIGILIFHKHNLIEMLALSAISAMVIIATNIFIVFKNPVHISLRENDIERFGVNGKAHVAYKDIQHCTLRDYDFDGITAHALEVLMTDGNTVIFEVAPWVSYNDIRSVFHVKEIVVN